MEQEILVPDIGDYSNVEIIEVTIKEGDHLKKDATMITLETDKATMDIPAPMEITIKQVHVKTGDRVSKGSLIATVATLQELDATELGRQVKRHDPNHITTPTHGPVSNNVSTLVAATNESINQARSIGTTMTTNQMSGLRGFANANPSVRKFARELGVNLENVVGTQKDGRISEVDVKNYIHQIIINNLSSSNSAFNASNNINPDFSKWGEVQENPLSRIKKKSGQHLHKNWLTIPHVTHFEHADLTALEEFRKLQQQLPAAKDYKLTPLVFLIQAIVHGLKTYPNFNSSLGNHGENLIIKKYYNIGVAVDTEHGLVVPVVKNADQKNIFTLAKELAELSQKARDNKLSAEDMQGGCFTISSLGGIGGSGFTPIINAPEVAILGVARHKLTPVYIDKELHARLILPLALSYDHRVIDGAEAAKFCKFIVEQLEDPKNFYA